jgi:hypothetical protein
MADDLDDLMDEEERWWYSRFLPELRRKEPKRAQPSDERAAPELPHDRYELLSPRDQAVFDAIAQERKRLNELRRHERAYREAVEEAARRPKTV